MTHKYTEEAELELRYAENECTRGVESCKRFLALTDDEIKVIEVELKLDGYRATFRNVFRRFGNPNFPELGDHHE